MSRQIHQSRRSETLTKSVALFTIVFASATTTGRATATSDAASCSSAAVQAAVTTAPDQTVVTIPAGICTWTAPVIVPGTKSLTLRGAGIASTIIVDGLTTGPILQITANDPHVVRLTDLTINADGVDKASTHASVLVNGSGRDNFRIDHVYFRNIRARGIKVNLDGNELSGLVDHNTFECPFSAACQAVTVMGDGAQSSTHMGRPYLPGSNGFIFVEDNVFNFTYQNDGGVEGYGGARYVLRFNTLHGVTQGHHGADSGNYRGTQAFEIYGNSFDHQGFVGQTNVRSHHFRSGTGFLWNNTYATTYSAIALDNYRSRDAVSGTAWADCDGTKSFDGNRSGAVAGSGWPCLDQIGWLFTDILNGNATLTPFYTFLNRKGGTQYDPTVAAAMRVSSDIVVDREFYNENSAFAGDRGVGVGALADRPSSCTTGVGYWATDVGEWNGTNGTTADGRFYKCVSTNTWALYYTPYQYPHPLQSLLLPPSNVRIIPQ